MKHGLRVAAGLFACLVPALSGAQESDTVQLFARACGKCHGAQPEVFLDQSLKRSGEVLTGIETGMPVADYLLSGHGKLTEAQVAELMTLFEILAEGQ